MVNDLGLSNDSAYPPRCAFDSSARQALNQVRDDFTVSGALNTTMKFLLRGALATTLLLTPACSGIDPAVTPQAGAPSTVHSPAPTHDVGNDDLERLAHVWAKRNQDALAGDYPIGPGDVLEITVPGMDEIKDVFVRVSAEGTISLPFAGTFRVNGMTDKAVRDEIRRRLQENFMRDPQVRLFVREFHSRQVAVIGAVQKPGLYSLTSSANTILSMISQAGGTTGTAAERILFIPAEPAEPDKAKQIISAMPVRMLKQDPSPLILKDVEPLVISLDGVNKGGQERYLNMPARPGDIVMVPGAGEVLIQGWVAKPGSYKITPGLTLLGVVAAAGGLTFPADSAGVELIRTNSAGHKSKLVADLDAIKSGASRDLPVREGDVVDVVSSSPKLVAYGFYRFFTSLVHVGASATIPIR
jgi:polysaccharide export outer membrane protein